MVVVTYIICFIVFIFMCNCEFEMHGAICMSDYGFAADAILDYEVIYLTM